MFGNKKKDEEIERLKRRIEELENQKEDENLLLNDSIRVFGNVYMRKD